MKLRIASLLLTLALPLAAQTPAASEAETMFYKAFYLEKGEHDFNGAMDLYQKFLDKAPDHALAAKAASNNFKLLGDTGKLKERDAFKAKYEKLLGNAANTPAPASGERGERGGRGGEGAGRGGEGAGRGERPAGGAGRPDRQARITELEKELAKAKEEKNDAKVKELEAQLEQARQGGRGQAGGQGGPGGRRGGLMGALMGNRKIADMTAEEITQLKEGLASYTIPDRMKQNMTEEQVKKAETNVDALKTALEANKTEDAQKALEALREAFPRGRGRGGEAGGAGGNRGGGGGNNGGGGGGGGR
jgi:hypothetical protein